MGEYSQQDFYRMRKWYGKWAMRYSMLYLLLGALLFPVTQLGYAPFILIIMLLIALTSHLHLWPVLRNSYSEQRDFRRVKYGRIAGIVSWIGGFSLVLFIDQRGAFLAGPVTLCILFGPPILMLEVYSVRLVKGAPNDKHQS